MATLFTGGSVSKLVVIYSINVFVTFSLAYVGMVRFWIKRRLKEARWIRRVWVHVLAAALCLIILVVTVFEKFREGAWITVLVTLGLTGLCFVIKRHYALVVRAIRRLDPGLSDGVGQQKSADSRGRGPHAETVAAEQSAQGQRDVQNKPPTKFSP